MAWFCLNGNVVISDDAGMVTVGVDGTDVLTAGPDDTLPPSMVDHADFGIGWVEDGQETADVYVDNIIVDTAPVPCR